jgi:deoxyadenosine/deoxycytidine kinase
MLNLPDNIRYLVVEGVIGVGKTSLARLLGEILDARLLLEDHENNPFLEDFYRDPARYAFQTQMTFLISRYNQQQQIPQQDIFHRYLVADYLFAKDRIFARMNLDERELVLYERLMGFMEQEILKPDLVIYLQARVERLMNNIRLRNRYYEKNLSEDYIRQLSLAYQKFFLNYTDTPLLIINTTNLDFVNRPQDLELITEYLSKPIRGTVYLNES